MISNNEVILCYSALCVNLHQCTYCSSLASAAFEAQQCPMHAAQRLHCK